MIYWTFVTEDKVRDWKMHNCLSVIYTVTGLALDTIPTSQPRSAQPVEAYKGGEVQLFLRILGTEKVS